MNVATGAKPQPLGKDAGPAEMCLKHNLWNH